MNTFALLASTFALVGLVSAEPLSQTPQGTELLQWARGAVSDNDTMNPEADVDIHASQARIAQMGTRADDMLAQMFLEILATREDRTYDSQGTPWWLVDPQLLLQFLSYDPAQSKKLLGPVTAWMDGAAEGRFRHSIPLVQQVGIYIDRWGGPAEKERLNRNVQRMLDSPAYEDQLAAKDVQRGIKGDWQKIFTLNGPFSKWCQWLVEDRKRLAAGLPPLDALPANPNPLPLTPKATLPQTVASACKVWYEDSGVAAKIWAAIALTVALALAVWLIIRRFQDHGGMQRQKAKA